MISVVKATEKDIVFYPLGQFATENTILTRDELLVLLTEALRVGMISDSDLEYLKADRDLTKEGF